MSQPIPRAIDHLDLSAFDFAALRWRWGEENIDASERLEGEVSGRCPLAEGYEEFGDLANYLARAASERPNRIGVELARMRREALKMAETVRAILRAERGLEADLQAVPLEV